MELKDCINFSLSKAQHVVLQHFKSQLAEFDVTPVQYGILKCLWKNDAQAPKQISEELSLDGSTITGILDRMENKDLVKRNPDPDDRRALRVVLTTKGAALKEPVEKVIAVANDVILQPFSLEEKVQFKKFLEKIYCKQ